MHDDSINPREVKPTATNRKVRQMSEVPSSLIETVVERLRQNKRVRRSLPVWGRIHIDRQLPFLCVYRRPTKTDDPGTERLATSEASYVIASATRRVQPGLSELIQAVARTLVQQFGDCLVLEMWAGPPPPVKGAMSTAELTPQFRLVAPKGPTHTAVAGDFQESLGRIKMGRRRAVVSTTSAARCSPKGLPPLLTNEKAEEIGCLVYGLEITPIYRDEQTGDVFPAVLRELRHKLTIALRRSFFQFSRNYTTHRPEHYHTLGRHAVVKAVWTVDRLLAEAGDQFDFLLQCTPVNAEEAWHEFHHHNFERRPTFHYRPLPAEPVVLKRNLYKAPVERVEDPALAQVFREKLDELDRQITMLVDRNTPRFLHSSLQLYGGVEDSLYELALDILRRLPSRSKDEASKLQLTPEEFAERGRQEIAYLQGQAPRINAKVEVRSDIAGLMVSRGNLLVGSALSVPLTRVDALIQHEVGTHVLTYHNGRAQRFQLLYAGLAGYDALQEGLAVLTEYLVGGLSRPRLRLLAARVVAVRRMIEGAKFVEVFGELDRNYDFARRVAFNITMRTFRAGGLTKDAVYLRGLCQILEYLGQGGELEPLYVGKISVEHIPIVRELQWRGVLRDPPMVPRYIHDPEAHARLDDLRQGRTVLDLIEHKPKGVTK